MCLHSKCKKKLDFSQSARKISKHEYKWANSNRRARVSVPAHSLTAATVDSAVSNDNNNNWLINAICVTIEIEPYLCTVYLFCLCICFHTCPAFGYRNVCDRWMGVRAARTFVFRLFLRSDDFFSNNKFIKIVRCEDCGVCTRQKWNVWYDSIRAISSPNSLLSKLGLVWRVGRKETN